MRLTGQLMLLAALFWAGQAAAQLDICNGTELRQSVSIGYEAPEGGWVSEGWWILEPGDCKTVMRRELARRYFYYRATVNGGGFDGPFSFCTQPEPYTIKGDADCEARGYRTERFRKIDTNNADPFTLTLVDETQRDPEEDIVYLDEAGRELSVDFPNGSIGEPFTQTGIFTGRAPRRCRARIPTASK
ncbi:MAG: DUF1036 domain-containing protein [Paracoccaceae bacterium]|nr:DUF1036 domain-containing protein [Paracoccaceae bacterium]